MNPIHPSVPAPGTQENSRCEAILAALLCPATIVGTRIAGTQPQLVLACRLRGNERTRAVCAIVLGAVAFLLAGTAGNAEENFYAGRQIQWILSADAGGGYASYARAFAPYFAKHIPGNPSIVIQHMPGAGGIRAMNYLNSVAPKDGTVLALVHSSVPFAPLFGLKGAKFDPRQMHWIGSLDANTAICIAWHTSRIKTWQDALMHEFTVGGSGAGSQMETMPAMLNKLFGAKMKIISGYKGGNEIYLAMERGEVDGRCGGLVSSINATRPDWFAQKKINVPIVVALERSPLFPDVPAVAEFAKDDASRQILQLFVAPQAMDRPILAPPGVPAARIALLRASFHAAMNDPGFVAEARKQHLAIAEIEGEHVAQTIAAAYALPRAVVDAAAEAMNVSNARGGE
jgi:tripartite-type tricarboxylate transporter receptor subunit TctC